MSDDELDSLTDKIGGGDEGGMEERLEDTEVAGVDDREPDELLDALRDDDPEESAEAADEIERIAEEEPERLEGHEDALVEILDIDDNWAKRAAVSALAEVGSAEAADELDALDMPEAEEAAGRIRERTGVEEDDQGYDAESETKSEPPEEAAASTTDGGIQTGSPSEGEGERALDAAKNGDADVEFSEIVLLQMLESDKDEPSEFAEQSLRHAVREYPEKVTDLTEEFSERLVDGKEDLRRYASLFMHEVSEEYVDEAREHVSELVDSLGDEEEVSARSEEALTNIAEEYPEDVVGNVAQKSKGE